jgi:MFS family permease
MMALVYAVQGAFWPLLAVHLKDLGISGRERGWIFATLALGSLAMPLGAGQLVDRRMSAQRVLALAYAVGTGLLVVLASGVLARAGSLFALFLVYWLVTAPTYGLSTALALRHLARPHQEFGRIRLWGTAGWMVVGWMVTAVMSWSGSTRGGQGAFEAFGLAAALSGLLAAYCWLLPDTPPLAVGGRGGVGGRELLELIGQREVAVVLVTALGVCLTTPFVFQVIPTYLEARGVSRAWTSTAMTLGQGPEIAALAGMPWLLRRMDYKGLLSLGILAWVVRYASLVLDPPLWVALAGMPLHGVGIACFSVAGQVFIDSRAAAHRRAGAQAVHMVLTSGVGSLLGSVLAGEVLSRCRGDSGTVFLVPCMINVGLLIYFHAGFRPHSAQVEQACLPQTDRPPRTDAARGTAARVGTLVTESADG